VVFSADLAPFTTAAQQLSGMLFALGSQADQWSAQFADAGRRAGAGLQMGLISQRDGIIAAARQVALSAAAALRGALQIHSPSRITYEMGKYFDEGLMQGILDGVGRVEQTAIHLSDRSIQSLSLPQPSASPTSSMDHALSRIDITIPLEVDGYRLGVAAIEGINRVSGGAGRTELRL